MISYWYWLLLFVPILALSRILGSVWSKGKLGEHTVNVGISRLLDQNAYRLIKNVTLPIGDGTTQIDHLIVSPFGIFVIETKNMKGWIFGQSNQAQWTQVVYRFKNKFQNPILQNSLHVDTVRALLGLRPDHVYNVVVFVGACTFKTEMPPEVVHGVLGLSDFIRTKQVRLFPEDEIHRCIACIQASRLNPSFRTERAHVRNVKKRIFARADKFRHGCPRCGGAMAEQVNSRTGERFLGCKRFPQCRGTRSLP